MQTISASKRTKLPLVFLLTLKKFMSYLNYLFLDPIQY